MVWVVAALVLGVLEMVTGGTLFLAMVATGALAGAVTAAVTDGGFAPWLVFTVVSVGLLVAVRPVAARHLRQPAELRSGVDRLVGLEAVVTEPVSGAGGRVKLNGEIWSARSFDHEASFPPGATVVVLEIEGATALVGVTGNGDHGSHHHRRSPGAPGRRAAEPDDPDRPAGARRHRRAPRPLPAHPRRPGLAILIPFVDRMRRSSTCASRWSRSRRSR